jgi:hypothetical protein
MSKRFCGKEMTDERMMVALSVLEGKLSPDVLTMDEIIEIQEKLMDLVAKLHQK